MSFEIEHANEAAEVKGEQSKTDLGFDPDKLIEPQEVDASREFTKDESARTDPEVLSAEVPGLDHTQQEIRTLEDGSTLFNAPEETGKTLNSAQGGAVDGFKGTCGLVSAENVARLAGKDVTEADVIDIAVKNDLCEFASKIPDDNGGTTVFGIVGVLDKLGIESFAAAGIPIKDVADAVESGRGVIAIVDTMDFWEGYPFDERHAVTLTSVERTPEGDVSAFYVCDSGTDGSDYARRVDVKDFAEALDPHRLMVITEDPIR